MSLSSVARRIRFRPNVRLQGADLDAADQREREVIGRHVVHGHATWGVALGFAIYAGDDGRQILVGPGIAFACDGTALPEPVARVLDVPLPLTGRVLLEIWAAAGASVPECAVGERAEELVPPAVRYAWCDDVCARVRPGRVVLCALRPAGAGFSIDLALRDVARDRLPPLVASGRETASWSQGLTSMTATIDISDRGFAEAPLCFAQLETAEEPPAGAFGPFVSITDCEADSFQVAVRCGDPTSPSVSTWIQGTTVSWTAVEHPGSRQPGLDAQRIFAATGVRVGDTNNWTAALAAGVSS